MRKGHYLVFLLIAIIIPAYSYIPSFMVLEEDNGNRGYYERLFMNTNKTYAQRRDYYLAESNKSGGLNQQMARVYLGNPNINENSIGWALDEVRNRVDCQDFRLVVLARLLYLNQKTDVLSSDIKQQIKDVLLDAKYWFTDPGNDTAIFWTENHQIQYHSSELLIGQMFPNETFSVSQMTGSQHAKRAERYIDAWMDIRAKTGFTEWHSNVYLEHDMAALMNLVDFANNQSIATRAKMFVDLFLFGFANNYFKAEYATCHARAYDKSKVGFDTDKLSRRESTTEIAWVGLGIGAHHKWSTGDKAVIAMVTSDVYSPPLILERIAEDSRYSHEHRERNSISVYDGEMYGLGYEKLEDIMYWWSLAAPVAGPVLESTLEVVDDYDLDTNLIYGPEFLTDFIQIMANLRGKSLEDYCEMIKQITRGIAMETSNQYTYRTPYYQLSGAQDHQKGLNGFQEHIWQATIDSDAYVFTSSPSGLCKAPGEFIGGWMPKAALYKNVGIIQYDRESMLGELELVFDSLGKQNSSNREKYHHAYFPQWAFDEIKESGNWVFGRRNDSYLALYSYKDAWWESNIELRVEGKKNVWITELGGKNESGSFSDFINNIKNARLNVNQDALGYSIQYESPSRGLMEVDWKSDLYCENQQIELDSYPRFDNPYCYQEFGSQRTVIEYQNSSLILDFENSTRIYNTEATEV